MNAVFPTSFTECFYFYDYVDFAHIFEGPEDAVVSTSVAWYDNSNPAIQISTTAESIEWADDCDSQPMIGVRSTAFGSSCSAESWFPWITTAAAIFLWAK